MTSTSPVKKSCLDHLGSISLPVTVDDDDVDDDDDEEEEDEDE